MFFVHHHQSWPVLVQGSAAREVVIGRPPLPSFSAAKGSRTDLRARHSKCSSAHTAARAFTAGSKFSSRSDQQQQDSWWMLCKDSVPRSVTFKGNAPGNWTTTAAATSSFQSCGIQLEKAHIRPISRSQERISQQIGDHLRRFPATNSRRPYLFGQVSLVVSIAMERRAARAIK